MHDAKSPLQSKTVWGGLVAILAAVAGFLGYSIAPADQAALINLVADAVTLAAGAVAIWGRITATKRIG